MDTCALHATHFYGKNLKMTTMMIPQTRWVHFNKAKTSVESSNVKSLVWFTTKNATLTHQS